MPPEQDNAKLRWEDADVPVSTRFNDPYYSRANGLAEARHVFLAGNCLGERFAATTNGFRIAELGFGTGLNVLAALDLWRSTQAGGTLEVTSFEKYPLDVAQARRALARWPEIEDIGNILLQQWHKPVIVLDNASIRIVTGDVADTLPRWSGLADAWFLDGFAPSRNPGMWTDQVLKNVGRSTAPGGTFATYTAAGFVRRGLQDAGFTVRKQPGFGSKREMLTGSKPESASVQR